MRPARPDLSEGTRCGECSVGRPRPFVGRGRPFALPGSHLRARSRVCRARTLEYGVRGGHGGCS